MKLMVFKDVFKFENLVCTGAEIAAPVRRLLPDCWNRRSRGIKSLAPCVFVRGFCVARCCLSFLRLRKERLMGRTAAFLGDPSPP